MVEEAVLPPDAAAFLREHLGDDWSARALAGDASVRAYYRISKPDGSTYMLAYYPEEVRSQLLRFLDAYKAVSPHGRLPEVLYHGEAAALQQDVGDRTLYGILHDDPAQGVLLYADAVELLVLFQRAPTVEINPPFTSELFERELDMTREFYVEKLMGGDNVAELRPLFRALAQKLAQHPYVLCHRDFHGQNIHIHNGQLYLIDYQDLRMGPDTYDLASLLRDRGVARIIGRSKEIEFVELYRQKSGAAGDVRQRYFETLLQRSIKIIGTFSRQPIERGKLHYLEFIPPTLESIARCLEELPEFVSLARLFPMNFSAGEARARLERRH
jgi:N-acetylmuramate 1-kinase